MSDINNKSDADVEKDVLKFFEASSEEYVEAVKIGVSSLSNWFLGSYADELKEMRDYLEPESQDPINAAYRLIILNFVCEIAHGMREFGHSMMDRSIKKICDAGAKVINSVKRLNFVLMSWDNQKCPKFGKTLLDDIFSQACVKK